MGDDAKQHDAIRNISNDEPNSVDVHPEQNTEDLLEDEIQAESLNDTNKGPQVTNASEEKEEYVKEKEFETDVARKVNSAEESSISTPVVAETDGKVYNKPEDDNKAASGSVVEAEDVSTDMQNEGKSDNNDPESNYNISEGNIRETNGNDLSPEKADTAKFDEDLQNQTEEDIGQKPADQGDVNKREELKDEQEEEQAEILQAEGNIENEQEPVIQNNDDDTKEMKEKQNQAHAQDLRVDGDVENQTEADNKPEPVVKDPDEAGAEEMKDSGDQGNEDKSTKEDMPGTKNEEDIDNKEDKSEEENFDALEEKDTADNITSQDLKDDDKNTSKDKSNPEGTNNDNIETKEDEPGEYQEEKSSKTPRRQPRKDLNTDKVYGEKKLSKDEIKATVERLHNSKKQKTEKDKNDNQVKESKNCSPEEIDGIVERLYTTKKNRTSRHKTEETSKKKNAVLSKQEIESLAERLATNKKEMRAKEPNRITEVESKVFKNSSSADKAAKVDEIVNRLTSNTTQRPPPDSNRRITGAYKECGIIGSYAANTRYVK